MPNWFSRGPYADVSSAGLVSRGEWALTVFRTLGAVPHPTSRLPKAIALFKELNKGTTWAETATDSQLNQVAEAHRTVWELFVIAYAADMRWQRAGTPFCARKVNQSLRGSETPDSETNTLARNTQFELYVAALLTLGGADLRLDEPDLLLLYGRSYVGVAVKRMSSASPAKLESRLLEASDQIHRWTSEGYIAINIDVYLRGRKLPSNLAERDAEYDRAVANVNRIVDKKFGRLHKVSGLLIFSFLASWDMSVTPPRFDNSYPLSRQLFVPADGAQVAKLEEFWNRLSERMDRQLLYLRTGSLDR